MARGVNKVILIGNAGSDPEVRRASNGNAIVSLSIATSEQWRDKNTGETQGRTEWHRVVFFGRLAEIVGDYARKGSKLYVEGKLQTRKWVTQDGQDRYTTEVVVDINGTMELLDSKSEYSATGSNSQYKSEPPPPRTPASGQPSPSGSGAPPPATSAPSQSPDTEPFDDDDIPF